MDHLPLPSSTSSETYGEALCYTSEPYDGGDWFSYPARQGFGQKRTKEWFMIFNNPDRDFLGFLQRWLFFGTLETFIGCRVPLESFTRQHTNPTRIVITTKSLEEYLEFAWTENGLHRRIESSDYPWKVSYLSIVINQLLYGNKKADGGDYEPRAPLEESMGLQNFMMRNNFKDPRPSELALSISLMIQAIHISHQNLRAVFLRVDPWRGWNSIAEQRKARASERQTTNMILPLNPELTLPYARLRAKGWCPSRIYSLYFGVGLGAMVYISQFDPPPARKPHNVIRICPAAESTSQDSLRGTPETPEKLCSPHHCASVEMNEGTYETIHVEGCNGCDYMGADPSEILRILQNGSMPLIVSIDPDEEMDSPKNIQLVESGTTTENQYVAISHVWSDGLGNPKENALPRCQMRRISRLIRSLPGTESDLGLFWIDTICCPPDSTGRAEAQRLAIHSMARTYHDARAVLVLDEWLCMTDSSCMRDSELLLRIIASNWNSRLWTFQEGALARKLIFQFADKAYNMRTGWDNFTDQASYTSMERLILEPAINDKAGDLLGFRGSKASMPEKVQSLISALQFRSTTVAPDEAICISNLLGINLKRVMDGSPETRMERLWKLVHEVPPEFAWRNWPRLDADGIRWAPRSMLRSSLNTDVSLNQIGNGSDDPEHSSAVGHILKPLRNDNGLHICGSGLFLPTGKFPINGCFIFIDDTGTSRRMLCAFDPDTNGAVTVQTVIDTTRRERRERRVDIWGLYGSEELVFIGHGHGSTMGSLIDVSMGVLAAVVRRQGEIVFLRNLCQAFCDLLSDGEHDHTLSNIIHAQIKSSGPIAESQGQGGRVLTITRAIASRPNQKWCID